MRLASSWSYAGLAVVLVAGLGAATGPAVAATGDDPVATARAAAPVAAVVAPRGSPARIDMTRWTADRDFRRGSTGGVRVRDGELRIRRAVGRTTYRDPYGPGSGRYGYARWTSPWKKLRFGADEIIPSWNARTPGGTFVEILVRGRTRDGRTGSWDTVASWAGRDDSMFRVSGSEQPDDLASLATDTVRLDGRNRYSRFQVRAVLLRPAGTSASPTVQYVGAVASLRADVARRTSRTTVRGPIGVKVPTYSQMIHRGEYPQWDNGGEAWCSPTSTTMVLRGYGTGPTRQQYSWVKKSYRDRFVDYAARHTFDHRYDGAGNWPFNTAYAATFDTTAFVTRFGSLRGVEKLVRRGIPVVASIAFDAGELDGSPLTSTNGHLLVIRGFTASGDVVVNDPAGPRNSRVRRVYDRGQLERVWREASGGVGYVIRPLGKRLPGGGNGSW